MKERLSLLSLFICDILCHMQVTVLQTSSLHCQIVDWVIWRASRGQIATSLVKFGIWDCGSRDGI